MVHRQPNSPIRRLAWALLLTAACSGAAPSQEAMRGGGPSAQEVSVKVSPAEVVLAPGEQVLLSSVVTGSADDAVTWAVEEGAEGGAVTEEGLYTAPITTGAYRVVATARADGTRRATVNVTVASAAPPAGIAVAVTPGSGVVFGCQSLELAATVTGTADRAVTWSVEEGLAGGTVTSAGVYIAPVNPGTYHVVATSAADPTRRATATVTVTTKVLSVNVAPADISVEAGAAIQFTATVTTTCGAFESATTI